VTTVAVLGAGIMGRGIADASALGGFRTLLQDTSERALEQGVAEIWATFEKGVVMGKVSNEAAANANKLLATVRSLEDAVRDADLVIEAVPERIELKVELFAQLARLSAKRAILASTTSSLSTPEMAAATARPARR